MQPIGTGSREFCFVLRFLFSVFASFFVTRFPLFFSFVAVWELELCLCGLNRRFATACGNFAACNFLPPVARAVPRDGAEEFRGFAEAMAVDA